VLKYVVRRILALFLALLTACSTLTSPPPAAPVNAGPTAVYSISNKYFWTDDGLAAIRDGVKWINDACGREILHEGLGGIVVIQRFAADEQIADPEHGILLGLYDDDAHTVTLFAPSTASPDLFRAVVAHEFFHALGVRHYEGDIPGVSIMAPSVGDQSSGVTALDIVRLGRAWECPKGHYDDLP